MHDIENIKKGSFIAIALVIFVIGGFVTQKTSLAAWSLSLVVYFIGLHWVYAFIWNKDMHYHLGKVPYAASGEHRTLRLCAFAFGLLLCFLNAFYT